MPTNLAIRFQELCKGSSTQVAYSTEIAASRAVACTTPKAGRTLSPNRDAFGCRIPLGFGLPGAWILNSPPPPCLPLFLTFSALPLLIQPLHFQSITNAFIATPFLSYNYKCPGGCIPPLLYRFTRQSFTPSESEAQIATTLVPLPPTRVGARMSPDTASRPGCGKHIPRDRCLNQGKRTPGSAFVANRFRLLLQVAPGSIVLLGGSLCRVARVPHRQ